MTRNQIEYQRNVENERSNRARETETNRSNLAQEFISQQQLKETARSNLAREEETNRANLAKEKETNRSNLANESLSKYGTDQKRASALETAEINAESNRYRADKAYSGTVESAYIKEYGIGPEGAKTVINSTVGAVKKAATNPKVVKTAASTFIAPKIAAELPAKVVSGLANKIKTNLKGGTENAGKTKQKQKQ